MIFKGFLLHCIATAVTAGRCTQPLLKSARRSTWEKRYHHIQIKIGVIKCQLVPASATEPLATLPRFHVREETKRWDFKSFEKFLPHCVATAVTAGRCTQPLLKSARQSRWEKRYHHIQIQIGVIKCQRTRPLGSSSAWDLTSWLEDSFHSLNRFNEAKSRLSWLLLHVFCTTGAPD